MVEEAHIVTIHGVEYITRQECERLLEEADNRRRLQAHARITELEQEIEALHDYEPGEM